MTTDKTAAKPGPSSAADKIGGLLLSQIRDELNMLPDSANKKQTVWGVMAEVQQAELLDRLKRRIRHALDAGLNEIFAEGLPSVRATVHGMNFKENGLVCSLKVPQHAKYRHELADATSQDVLVLITPDIDKYMESTKMVKPDSDQPELALDPAEEDPRSSAELVSAASALSIQLGEEDATADAPEWSRQHLLDYINWAEGKLGEAQEQAAASG